MIIDFKILTYIIVQNIIDKDLNPIFYIRFIIDGRVNISNYNLFFYKRGINLSLLYNEKDSI
ncbi:MAG TPA: hypothetical protein PKJ39_02855 [Caldisericia bacterium]|nr:hypothetical protein [Caldisericia bacterium]HQL66980.1 hypothetical protein [Caldisericia bacterium]HQN49164.1 hypothetical protein [Caldisericia bacterium]